MFHSLFVVVGVFLMIISKKNKNTKHLKTNRVTTSNFVRKLEVYCGKTRKIKTTYFNNTKSENLKLDSKDSAI